MYENQTFPDMRCVICGALFTPRSPRARTCSWQCGAELNRRTVRERKRERLRRERANEAAASSAPTDTILTAASSPSRGTSAHASVQLSTVAPKASLATPTAEAPRPDTTAQETSPTAPSTRHQAPGTNPEPRTEAERAAQIAAVEQCGSLPYAERYEHSRRWSRFQRLHAIAIEKKLLAEHDWIEHLVADGSHSPTSRREL